MGLAGHRKVVEEFDAEKCAAQLARLFREMDGSNLNTLESSAEQAY